MWSTFTIDIDIIFNKWHSSFIVVYYMTQCLDFCFLMDDFNSLINSSNLVIESVTGGCLMGASLSMASFLALRQKLI
jgi:hypothetical protein